MCVVVRVILQCCVHFYDQEYYLKKVHDHDYNCFLLDGENDWMLMMNIWQL